MDTVIVHRDNIDGCAFFNRADNRRTVGNITVNGSDGFVLRCRLLGVCELHIHVLCFNIIKTFFIVDLIMPVLRSGIDNLKGLVDFNNARFYIIRIIGSGFHH